MLLAAAAQSDATYPKEPPGARVMSGAAAPSALLNETVLPHHVWIVFFPIPLLSGYCRMKKMRIADTATPESSAADRTSKIAMRCKPYILYILSARQVRTVVLSPPREVTPTDDVVEDESDDRPRDVVEGRRWRDETRAAEDDREVDVFHEGVRPLERDEVSSNRTTDADDEEEHETAGLRVKFCNKTHGNP